MLKLNNVNKKDVIEENDYEQKVKKIRDKIANISGLVKKTEYDTYVKEIESKMPSCTDLLKNWL